MTTNPPEWSEVEWYQVEWFADFIWERVLPEVVEYEPHLDGKVGYVVSYLPDKSIKISKITSESTPYDSDVNIVLMGDEKSFRDRDGKYIQGMSDNWNSILKDGTMSNFDKDGNKLENP